MSFLTTEQVQQYADQSFLLVSGLIPDDVAKAAEAAMWRLIEADPNDPATWANVSTRHGSYDSPELVACCTAGMVVRLICFAPVNPWTPP